eukprot:Skav219721  [mRNA]  locus=scaffold301:60021:65635:+ [translate_table: standard]
MKICQQCACPLAGVPSETITWFDLGARSHGSLVCSHGDWLKCEDLTPAAWEGSAGDGIILGSVPSIRGALPQRWEPLKALVGRGAELQLCLGTYGPRRDVEVLIL